MTTILADAKARVMVADTLGVQGSRKFQMGAKVQRHNGSLYGFSGDITAAQAWFECYTEGRETPETKASEAFDVLILDPDGTISLYPNGQAKVAIGQDHYAIGSGGEAALAAYRALELAGMKPDAALAVEAACHVNTESGLPLAVYPLDAAEPARKPRGKR